MKLKFIIYKIWLYRYHYFGFNLVSTDIVRRTEVLVYPPVSFISEMGGSLGLFVGFSFLGIWDFFIFMKDKLKSYYVDGSK